MPLPFLNATEQSIDMIDQFGGYNHRVKIADNEFYDMKNMSSKDFPLISTRKHRGIFNNNDLKNANAIVAKDNILYSFTGFGDIGVTLAQSVEKNEWVEPPEPVDNAGKTVFGQYNKNDLTKHIINNDGVSAFGRYIWSDSSMAISSGKSPIIEGDNLVIEWNHDAVPKGALWAKSLFTVEYVYIRDDSIVGNKQRNIAVNSNAFLKSSLNRKKMINEELWINNQKIKVTDIESSSLLWNKGDWKITIDLIDSTDFPEVKKGDEAFVRLIEPLQKSFPEGKFKEESEAVNQATKVSVVAASDMHIKVLKGKTISFEDSQGSHECYVSNYEIDGDNKSIVIDCPHDAIEQGAKAYGDRLYLCEYNPFTNKSVVSDIFPAAEGKHTLVEMGGYVVVFPEKVMVNTQKRNMEGSFTDIQPLELIDNITGCEVRLVDANGNTYENISVGTTAPENPSNKDGWIDTTDSVPSFKVYSSQIEQWAKVQTYCEIRSSSKSINNEWQNGDAVELEFQDESVLKDVITPITEQKYFVISATGETESYNYIRFPATMKSPGVDIENRLMIRRTVPDMDFVIENENRLWGCKYGDVDGEPINEIFACKLGDPKNWHCFSNTSMDSYYVSLGADGEFTGAISYAGNPFFFREGCVHRIYGNYPSNYSLKTIYCHGVEKGSEKGITVMNDVMYYKSPVGIMAYTGASPVNVSEYFGNERYKNAVAGAVGSKMYFSMQDMEGNNVFFEYDDITKMWHKADDLRCKDMVVFENDVYALSSYNELISMNGGVGSAEESFEWYIVSGNIGYNTPFFKHIARLNIRMNLDRTARASVYVQYNSDGNWHRVSNLEAKGRVANLSVAVSPQRCDHFAIKIEGKGDVQIYSISKFIEGGSENE